MAKLAMKITYPAMFCDGGIITMNPSPLGGTWAARLVHDHPRAAAESLDALGNASAEDIEKGQLPRLFDVIKEASGVVVPADFGINTISNNFTEAYAMLMGLRMLPDDWGGLVCSDSLVTIGRFFQQWQWRNTPSDLQRLCLAEVKRVNPSWYLLLDGHPTKAQLLAGIGKRGNHVSEHNVWCDKTCTAAATAWKLENANNLQG